MPGLTEKCLIGSEDKRNQKYLNESEDASRNDDIEMFPEITN